MCGEHYLWKNHAYFVKGRSKNIYVSFYPNPHGGFVFRRTPIGDECSFTDDMYSRTVFVNTPITKGIFRWTVKMHYGNGETSSFGIGAAPAALLDQFHCLNLGSFQMRGSWAFTAWKTVSRLEYRSKKKMRTGNTPVFHSNLQGHEHVVLDKEWRETDVPSDSLVSAEIDCATRTLAFFVDRKKVPMCFSGVQLPLHFGVSGSGYSSFITVTFRRLPSPTPSFVVCKSFKAWIEKKKK